MKASKALARIGAHGLPGANTGPNTVDSFPEFLALVESQRMLQWLSAAVEDGLVENVSAEEREQLRERTLVAIQTTLAAHSAAVSVITRLRSVGVSDVRVLKGCATAHLDYSPLRRRYSTDVDLLVRPADYDLALSIFPSADVPPPRSANFQRRYGKATTVVDESRVEIDVHTMLTHGYFGLVVPLPELMACSDQFEIGGVEMLALDRPNRLLHAATHVAASEYIGMHSARDVLQLVLVAEADWDETIDRATRWKVDGLFARGVLMAWTLFDIEGHPLVEWAERHRPIARQRLALGIAGTRAHGPQMTGPLALPLHRWPGYILPFAFPSREFLAARGESRGALGKRFTREILSK